VGDKLYFINSIIYTITALRDDGWFWYMPVAGGWVGERKREILMRILWPPTEEEEEGVVSDYEYEEEDGRGRRWKGGERGSGSSRMIEIDLASEGKSSFCYEGEGEGRGSVGGSSSMYSPSIGGGPTAAGKRVVVVGGGGLNDISVVSV